MKTELKHAAPAVALLRSWLRATKTPFVEPLAPPAHLVVGAPSKAVVRVRVLTGPADTGPRLDPPGVNVNGAALCLGTEALAFSEFWRVTSAVGVPGHPRPVNRGTEFFAVDADGRPRRVTRQEDGDDLVVFRHSVFRRAPDPTKEQVRTYESVVAAAARLFHKHNYTMLKRLGYDHSDLLTYAWVWAITYMAFYELPWTHAGVDLENQKLMNTYLQQRFALLKSRLEYQFMGLPGGFRVVKKVSGRNRLPVYDLGGGTTEAPKGGEDQQQLPPRKKVLLMDRETISLSLGMPPYYSKLELRCGDYTVPEGLLQSPEGDITECLRAHLQALPHDDRVAALQGVIDRQDVDADAREEAQRWLDDHRRRCGRCGPAFESADRRLSEYLHGRPHADLVAALQGVLKREDLESALRRAAKRFMTAHRNRCHECNPGLALKHHRRRRQAAV